MRKAVPTSQTAKFIAGVVLATLLAGCTATQDWLSGRKTATPTEDVNISTSDADQYLQELYQLTTGDAFTQVEIVADAKSAATLTPDASTKLRYGLVLATPGHADYDPGTADSMLRDALSESEMLGPGEVALGTVMLKDVEDRLVLNNEVRQLRDADAAAQTSEERAIAERIARVEAENRRLREELADAEQKLEAITSIERSMRTAENDTN